MDEIVKSFKPLAKISGYFGFLPFNLDPSKGSADPSKPKVCFAVILVLIYSYFIYLRAIHNDEYRQQGSFLSKITLLISHSMTEVLYIVTVVVNFLSRRVFADYLRTLWKFDDKAKSYNFTQNYQEFELQGISAVTTTIISFILLIFLPYIALGLTVNMGLEEFLGGTIAHFFWAGSAIYIVDHCLILQAIRSRICVLNQILECSISKSTVMAMSTLHIKLCELITDNNRISSFQVASTIAVNIMNASFILFEFYELIIYENRNFLKIIFCVGAITYFLYSTFGIVLILIISTITMREGLRTIEVIHEQVCRTKVSSNKKLTKRIQLFLMQLSHLNANVSCGFFELDWKVLMMMFGSVTSYLIIMIQFGQLIRSKDERIKYLAE